VNVNNCSSKTIDAKIVTLLAIKLPINHVTVKASSKSLKDFSGAQVRNLALNFSLLLLTKLAKIFTILTATGASRSQKFLEGRVLRWWERELRFWC
jgi:hypothetical protein